MSGFSQSSQATLQKVKAERCKRRIAYFVRCGWHVVEPATPYIHGWHVDAICEHLEAVTNGQIFNLLINMPPRHMKSLLVSVFWPCWEWISHPERRWLFASYAQSLSTRDSIKCRRLIQSPWYQSLFSDMFALTSDQNQKTRFDNDKTGYRLATSVDGASTGEGGDRIVADDPHNVREAESDAVRQSTLEWWDESMSTRGNNPKTVARVIVMQRVHEGDLSGHVLEQGGYEHLCLPAEYDGDRRITSIGWSDPRRKDGELLCPDRFGPKELAELKLRLGSVAAAGQLQQRPAPRGGNIFRRHWWRFWHEPNSPLPPVMVRMDDGSIWQCPCEPLPDKMDTHLQSWDMSFKGGQEHDYVVGQVWSKAGARAYLRDQSKDHRDMPETINAVKALAAKWPHVVTKLVEDKANGPAVIASLRKEVSGLIAVDPDGDKIARASAVSPLVEAGNVYLPHPSIAPWVESFIASCGSFPNAKHDDDVDAFTQAVRRLLITDSLSWIVT